MDKHSYFGNHSTGFDVPNDLLLHYSFMTTIIPPFLCGQPGEAWPESSQTGWPGLTFDELRQEFSHGVGDSSPTLREAHCGISSVHQLMQRDGTPSLKAI